MAPPPRRQAGRHRREPDPYASAIGARIRRLRTEREFSFDAFVEETGLGRGYVSELERGLVVPTVHALASVAAALDLTVADLVSGDSLRERIFEAMLGLPQVELERLMLGIARLRKAAGGAEREQSTSRAEPVYRSTEPGRGSRARFTRRRRRQNG